MNNFFTNLFIDKKKEEIAKLKDELETERSKNLKDIKLLNKKFKALITSGEVEFVIKNIDEIRRENEHK